ncbi:MAG TPA: PilX N-terminal domain-containing pilus assembly protein [Nitrospirota bacterium]|nr:PilX N-terminal domain-containing pilus assembly protein [Nitrospirota bacterium]
MRKLHGKVYGDERGAALITALLFLTLLTVLGLASIYTSTTEVMISRNDYKAKQALYAADAGIQEAMAKIDYNTLSPAPPADPATNPDWQAPFNGTVTNDAFTATYSVTVKFKREGEYGDNFHLTGDNVDNDQVVRYNKGFQYSSSPILASTPAEAALKGRPVFSVVSVGTLSGGENPATATLVVDVSENTLNVYAPSGLYSNACITASGSYEIDSGSMPAYISPCSVVLSNATGASPVTGAAPYPAGGFINLTGGVGGDPFIGAKKDQIKEMAQSFNRYYKNLGGNNWVDPPGNPEDADLWPMGTSTEPETVYIELPPGGDFHINANKKGYGVLYVDGDFIVNGDFEWEGLLYVTGDLKAGTGSCVIDGGVMVGGATECDLGGNASFSYDGDILDNIAKIGFKQKVLNWRRYYGPAVI